MNPNPEESDNTFFKPGFIRNTLKLQRLGSFDSGGRGSKGDQQVYSKQISSTSLLSAQRTAAAPNNSNNNPLSNSTPVLSSSSHTITPPQSSITSSPPPKDKKEPVLRNAVLAKKIEETSPDSPRTERVKRHDSPPVSFFRPPSSITLPVDEPEYIKRIRNEVKKDVFFLIQDRKLANLEEPAFFFLKEKKKSKASSSEGEYGKPIVIKLQKNHQVIQILNADNETSVQRLLVTDIASVESVVPTGSLKRKNTSSISLQEDGQVMYTLRFVRREDRESIELTTENEGDHVRWLEGLEALIGAAVNTHADTIAMMKILTEIEMELRLLAHEEGETIKPPTLPNPPANYNFLDVHLQNVTNEDSDNSVLEDMVPTTDGLENKHWRRIFYLQQA